MRRRTKNIITISKNISLFVLGALFTWAIVSGFISVIPKVSGLTMIGIGFFGLVLLGYLGRKKFK